MRFKLGDLVELYNKNCNQANLTVWDISGINKDKEFFSPAKQVGADTSKYKIVPPHYFACNLMHVGRDVVLPISLNTTDKNIIVSPAYTVFKLKRNDILLNEYFFMWLKSDEKDRYFWLFTDSSIRDGFSWTDFCDIHIDLPPLATQQKYVAVYQAMLANQRVYEQGLDDLKLTCDAYIERLKNQATMKVGDIFKEIDNRNATGAITDLQGINIEKVFMPSVANVNQDNLSKYKIVRKHQFAYSAMQTGRDECIRIALYNNENPCIISPAYSVLEIKRDDVLAEFVMMWFSRKEVDRYGAFISDSSIRASLELPNFFEMQIPIPPLAIQQAIVAIYQAYLQRKAINEQLKNKIKQICPVLVRGAVGEIKCG